MSGTPETPLDRGPGRRRDARFAKASAVGTEHARATWALAARERLVEAAQDYHSVVTDHELADFVQDRSLIATDQHPRYWIGDVLTRVGRDCVARREPILSALCVTTEGTIGKGYTVAVEEGRREPVADPDDHAAQERLECYRYFGAPLPEGGGVPALPPQLLASRSVRRPSPRSTGSAASAASTARPSRAAKPAAPEKELAFCPVHFTQLPATGVCDLCE